MKASRRSMYDNLMTGEPLCKSIKDFGTRSCQTCRLNCIHTTSMLNLCSVVQSDWIQAQPCGWIFWECSWTITLTCADYETTECKPAMLHWDTAMLFWKDPLVTPLSNSQLQNSSPWVTMDINPSTVHNNATWTSVLSANIKDDCWFSCSHFGECIANG